VHARVHARARGRDRVHVRHTDTDPCPRKARARGSGRCPGLGHGPAAVVKKRTPVGAGTTPAPRCHREPGGHPGHVSKHHDANFRHAPGRHSCRGTTGTAKDPGARGLGVRGLEPLSRGGGAAGHSRPRARAPGSRAWSPGPGGIRAFQTPCVPSPVLLAVCVRVCTWCHRCHKLGCALCKPGWWALP